MKNYLILLCGIAGAASSVFFIRLTVLPPALYSGLRLFLAATILAPFAWRAVARHSQRMPCWRDLLIGLPAALPLAVHYWSWFIGVRHVSAASAGLLVNVTPVLMPFLVWALLSERVNVGEIVGSLIAIAGVVLLAVSRDASGETTTRGILICVGSMSLCALYLALGRKFGRGRHILTYMVPLYCIAGVSCLLISFASHEPLPAMDGRQWLLLLGAVLAPTVIGHTALNHAMVHLPPQVVSIANLGQFIVVAILAIPILGEDPHRNLALPALLVVIGALIVIRAATPRVRATIEDAAMEPAGT